GGILGDVARAGNGHATALEMPFFAVQHLLREIDTAVSGGFGPHQAAPVGDPFAREDAVRLVGDAFVLAIEKSDLPGSHPNVTSRHVHVRAEMAIELGHEGLAKAHDLRIAASLRIEVGPALAASDGQGGEGVFQDLFKGEELEDAKIHRGVKAQTSLVGADGAVHLDSITAVD